MVILNDDKGIGYSMDGYLDTLRASRNPIIRAFALKSAAPLWITGALLAAAWTSQAHGSPQALYLPADARARAHQVSVPDREFRERLGVRDIERLRAGGFVAKPMRLAQAAPDDPKEVRKPVEQEHDRAEPLAGELTINRHLEMALTLNQARAEAARFKQLSETEHAELRKYLQQERMRLKEAAASGAAELCRIVSDDRPGQPAEAVDTIGRRTSLQQQPELVAEAAEQAIQANCKAESNAADLGTSLQQERERAAQLERDLAAARSDVETQTALASRANEEVSQAKRSAESDAADLGTSLQQERERAAQLERDLAAARSAVATQTALASRASEEVSKAKRSAESDAADLGTSLQQERERAAQLQKDLAAARRDVETQTALASTANEEASQAKRSAESDTAGLRKSLQQERERAAQLQKDLVAARRDVETQTALASTANEDASHAKRKAESGAAELTTSLQQEKERATQLEKDLAAARLEVETQTALASKANERASQLTQVADQGSVELQRSLQKEQERAEALAKEISMAHTAVYACEAQARKASDQTASSQQAGENGAAALRKSLQQEQERAGRLQQDLTAAQRDLETQTVLAAKAGAEAARLKQTADDSTAEASKSLQRERDKTARLERELAAGRKTKETPSASGGVTAGRAPQDKLPMADAIRPVTVSQATATAARDEAKPDPMDAAEVARLVARASVLLGQGDIGSARIALERAAEMGNAQANFALAETYDPLVLRKWGVYGTLGDVAKARDLYARAQAGGVKEAKERFDARRR
jgi:hypothetical protein